VIDGVRSTISASVGENESMSKPMRDRIIGVIQMGLRGCKQRGLRPPFVVYAKTPNGSFLYARFHDVGAAPEVFGEHLELGNGGDGPGVTLTCRVLDQTGEEFKLSIEPRGRMQ
jgi:hypothetical protein